MKNKQTELKFETLSERVWKRVEGITGYHAHLGNEAAYLWWLPLASRLQARLSGLHGKVFSI